MRVAFARQRRRNQLRHPPSARSFDPGGEHDLPGQEPVGFAAVLRLAHMHGENARGDRLDVEHLGAVSDRDADGVAHPQQIFVPEIARDLVELLPGLNAESCFVPGPHRQARDAEVRSGDRLRRAERVHPRIGRPGTFLPGRVAVEHDDVKHPFAHQAEGDGGAALTAADDDDAVHVLAVMRAGLDPGPRRIADALQFVGCPPGQRFKSRCDHLCSKRGP